MKRMTSFVLFATITLYGQNTEIGAVVGGGAVGVEDVPASGLVAVGAEICALCKGNFALFGDYTHLQDTGTRSAGITSFDLIASGLRIQGGERVRPFFDAGVAYGVDRFQYPAFNGGFSLARNSHGNAGVVLAGGAAVRLGSRFYIRPQLRVYGLAGPHAAIWAGMGFGIRL